MEFYFSDANLHKDRFIKQLMDQREDKCMYLTDNFFLHTFKDTRMSEVVYFFVSFFHNFLILPYMQSNVLIVLDTIKQYTLILFE